ncbi:peptidyl-tRNA hydrolase domain protein [Aspergillus clavatus NRRL 1]|uniref:Peptidyl-tRNA hydrolase domain protein n=1 Tax=Aspergillus clavatus (strain ATCC 1007 / CBS 513.65 / DSM 816 / NCTC 3887 / NRRL 1 / QM 1276 / 107) TaxID=344612 RepID=A1CK72_ASPCL|nr:peptidyl-tRNA hydrolase domain protein [Aspergillus clavatus NRRL 1]EAW09546.1 peptidyl-tRNA hydrolase domain protein [Aspergillus clavatus NRRL 1]
MSIFWSRSRIFDFLRNAPAGPTRARPFASRRAATVSQDHTAENVTEEELTAARAWLAGFSSKTIPRDICEISFSRSGGPGGQNVNKVNSKATLKVPLQSLLPLVPRILHPRLRLSRYYAERTHTLVIQSEESRKQAANVESCYEKLHNLLKTTADDVIPGETSEEQRDRVQKLRKAENEARVKAKKLHSSKKSSRRGNKYDE